MKSFTVTVALSLGFICLAFSSVEAIVTKTANSRQSSGKQLSQNSTAKPNGVCNVIHNYNFRGTSCQETKALLYHMSKQLNDVKKQLDEVQTALESLTKDMKPLHVIICERNKTTISCKNGRNLTILDAIYGRSDRKTCNTGPILSTNCRAAKSLSVVKSACQGKASCVLHANNSVFGDPCHGTHKYLLVKYKCLE